jgi:hypothetical protein
MPRIKSTALLAGSVLVLAFVCAHAQAPSQQSPAQQGAVQQQAPVNGLPDIYGNVGALQSAAPLTTQPPTTACLQLHAGTAVFNLNVTINPDVFPYTVTGGSITGNICGAPWAITGGTLGASLSVNGQRNPPASGCASTISIAGGFANPTSYIGTYGFNGSNTMFNHRTLFLGFERSTCP